MTFYTRENFLPDTSLGYLLRLNHQATVAGLDRAFAAEGITAVQWSALISIHFQRGLTCAALARDLTHDKGAMTRMIDMLEERGLVRRERNADDRRVIDLALTPAGETLAMRCRDRMIECWNGWLTDWSRDEVAALIAQLQKLRRTLEAAPSCAG